MTLMRSPANVEAAQLFKENTKEYERRVKVGLFRGCDSAWERLAEKQQTVEQSWVDNPEELEAEVAAAAPGPSGDASAAPTEGTTA